MAQHGRVMKTQTNAPGIRSIGTALPERFVEVEKLAVASEAGKLRGFGFDGAWLGEDVAQLAVEAAERALSCAALPASEIDALLWTSAIAESHVRPSALVSESGAASSLQPFCYQASWLQEHLGMERATVSGVAQQGCAGMFSALRQARALLFAEPELNHALCVGADLLPATAPREILYNVISDAACACVMSREQVRYQWLGFHQVSKGYYWDVPAKQSEIIAAYFPTAALTLRGLFSKLQLAPREVDLVIPTGVNRTSWPILMRLCGIPEDRLYEPARRFGHTIAADSFLVLEEARTRGALRPGMKLLLFAYGFGSSWCALLLETTDLIES
jgi:3-oxoacyl-[acyl-carrier-protein] synthase-3